ncbi:MAG: tail fiber domain-containing protein, partial [Candidatus Staskawiczbacteria bacterium]|nr:tail fiber domain-containing protein [Candidatus Staskawiczbacteria bacterium]
VAGDVRANAFLYSSDARLKTNINSINDSLSKVQQLRGVTFNWKISNKPGIGFIAQEVEQVFPELVSTDSNTGMKAVQYANIVPVIVEAIKDQQQQIKEQQKQLDEYRQELNILRAQIEALQK